MEGISWKRAYAGSLLIHLVVAGLLAVGLAGSVAQHEQEKMYVVDLDASDLTDSGSGSGTGEGNGEGSGSGSGEGPGSGSGSGGGSGSGTGSGSGDGQGYGQGTGDGQGSGDSGAAGTGSAPFDSDGFWSAVNANKSYPPMAIKRGLTGTVTVTVVLDSSGNCVSASADSSGLLAKAAVNAVYAACPYPNGTGSTVTVHVPVTFNIQ